MKNPSPHFETVINEKEIFRGRVFRVGVRNVVLEDGEKSVREVVYHNGGVAVLPVDSEGNTWLVRQYRCAFDCEVTEIPAGKLEQGEDHFEAAKRELQEETGFTAEKFVYLGEYWPTVGYCSEKIYLYLATGLTPGETHLDEDEFLECEKVPLEKVIEMVCNGEIPDAKTQIAALRVWKMLSDEKNI